MWNLTTEHLLVSYKMWRRWNNRDHERITVCGKRQNSSVCPALEYLHLFTVVNRIFFLFLFWVISDLEKRKAKLKGNFANCGDACKFINFFFIESCPVQLGKISVYLEFWRSHLIRDIVKLYFSFNCMESKITNMKFWVRESEM